MVIRFNFDTISIPEGFGIAQAKLHMYNYGPLDSIKNAPKMAYHLNGDWSPETVTWNSKPEPNLEAGSNMFMSKSFDIWETFDITELVRDIIVGDSTNKGFCVMNFNGNSGGCTYYSSEYEVQEFRPKLEIQLSSGETLGIELLSHNDGANVKGGRDEKITWETTGASVLSAVTVHYKLDNRWELIDSVTDGTSELLWSVPTLEREKVSLIRVTAYDTNGEMAVDSSDTAFTIEKGTSLISTSLVSEKDIVLRSHDGALSIQVINDKPAKIALFSLRGQELALFVTNISRSEYHIAGLSGERILIIRMKDDDGVISKRLLLE